MRTLLPFVLGLIVVGACTGKEETGQEPEPQDTDTGSPSPDSGETGESGETGHTDETGEQAITIADIQQGLIPVDTVVTLEGVVMASPNTGQGFFVVDPDGGPYSGIWVYHRGYLEFFEAEVGDELRLTGVVGEYSADGYEGSLTELEIASVSDASVTGDGTLPAPTVLTPEDLADPATAEMYEGALVRVDGVTVTDTDLEYGEWQVDGTVNVDDLFYDVEDMVGVLGEGDSFSAITGPLYFSYGAFKLTPRDDRDFEGFQRYCAAALCVDDLGVGDLVITEVLANPDTCSDPNGEYIELYNATVDDVDLFALEISDASTTVVVDDHVIVAPGEYAWLANGTSPSLFCYASAGEPDYYYGSRLGLNNDTESLTIGFTGEASTVEIDLLSWSGEDFAPRGVAMGLDAAVLDAGLADDLSLWCAQTALLGDTTDAGTPGEANESCPEVEVEVEPG